MATIKQNQDVHKRMFGDKAEAIEAMVYQLSPELAKFSKEFILEFYGKEELLDLKTRELITLSSLTTQGSTLPQLNVHIEAALNVGCSIIEIEQTLLQLVGYIGVPKVINAMKVLKEVSNSQKSESL